MVSEVIILLQIALFIISFRVFCGINKSKNMWRWISLYWIVLTVKNLADLFKVFN